MTQQNTDFGKVADDLRRAATSFALLTSSASVFGKSLTAFRDFEKQMVLTNAIAGGTEAQLKQMTEAARQFSLVTTASALDAGRALQQLAQAGFTAEESLQGMVGVLLLAQATFTDVAVASDVLSSNIRAFGLETSDTVRIANVFTAAITGSLATMDKLAFAMRQVAPVAELAGLSVEETTAALGVLFNVGLRGEQAGTALRNVIIRLVRPLGAAKDMLIEAGVATHTATGEFRNLADILLDIGNSDLSNADLARIFETEALAGVKALINSLQTLEKNGVNVYENLKTAITGTNRAVELTARNLSTFDGAMLLFHNRLEDVGRTIGGSIAPIIESLTDFLSDMIDGFNEYSPATRKLIASSAAFSAALLGLLASLNAVLLLMRGPLLMFLGRVAVSFGTAAVAATGLSVSMSGLAVGAASAVARLGAMVPIISSLGAIAPLAGFVAAFATGLGALAAAGYGAYKALDYLTVSQQEYSDAIERTSDVFDAAKVDAQKVADSIISQEAMDEVKYRLSFLQKEIAIAGDGLNLANYAFTKTKQIDAEIFDTQGVIKQLEQNFDGVVDYLYRERLFNEQLEDYFKQNNGLIDNVTRNFVEGRLRKRFLAPYLDELTDEQRAELSVLREKGLAVADQYVELTQALDSVTEAQKEGLHQFLFALQSGDESLGKDLSAAETTIRASGVLDTPGAITEIVDFMVSSGTDPSLENIAKELLFRTDIPVNEIADLLKERERNQTAAFIKALQSLESDTQADSDKLRVGLLKQELARTDNLARAIELTQDIGISELETSLQKLSEDMRSKVDNVLVDYTIDTFQGAQEILREAANNAGFTAEDIPGFAEAISGEAFIQSVRDRIDASTTPEEAQAVIEEQRQMYTKLVESYIQSVVVALNLTDEQKTALISAAQAVQRKIDLTVMTGLGDVTDSVNAARKRSEKETQKLAREASRAAKEAEREAERALRSAREVEDAFFNVAQQMRDAQESYYDAVRGLSPAAREKLSLDLDVDRIRAEAENQITGLRRELEDLSKDFTGPPEKLSALQDNYGQLIDMIERSAQAEIAATQSFEAMMDRRSAALDLFARDMRDAAFQSQDSFSQVGAGISIAFAEYQKDLVSLVDITKDATTDFIDSVSSLIGDFIFDTENAWDSFRKSILQISRKVVEGFTKAFLQQAISSFTGGLGSIFGNKLQPSDNGSTGVPGIGSGGVLGDIFPELFKGTQQTQGDTSPIAGAVQKTSSEMDSIFSNMNIRTEQTFDTFLTGLRSSLNNVVTAINNMAKGSLDAAGPVGEAVGQATLSVSKVMEPVYGATASVGAELAKTGNALVDGIAETANALGVSSRDLAAVISYETGGTFNPLQRGPTTQWGQHRGLIQFGEPQSAAYGVDFSSYQSAIESQLGPNGAIVKYLKDNGFEEGMGVLDLYSTINAGAPGRYNASDANNGGAPGSVLDKVTKQFGDHYGNADRLLTSLNDVQPAMAEAADTIKASMEDTASALESIAPDITELPTSNAAPLDGEFIAPQQTPYGDVAQSAIAGATEGGGLVGQGLAPQQLGMQFQQMFQQFLTQMQTTLTQFTTQFQTTLQQAIASMSAAASGAAASRGGGTIAGMFASGGEIRGPGTGTSDSILARVSDGEFIVAAKHAQAYKPVLNAINNGANPRELATALEHTLYGSKGLRTPAYASGGLVGGSDYLPGPLGGSIQGGSSYVDNSKAGDTYNLRVNYNMRGGAEGGRKGFKRSASQHAKRLAIQLDKARRNI